jgi:carboxypeptidase C (cathepsin A)
MPDVAEDLRDVMSKNPRLKIFTANGYFDFATPFFQTEYSVSHMGLDPSLVPNIAFAYYQSGHMIYLNAEARKQMKADIGHFFDSAVGK